MGDHPERLVALLGRDGSTAAVIANAADGYPADGRQQGVQREIDALAALGIEATELDLRRYFSDRERLADELRRYQLIWVRGGSAFLLRHALWASGADTLLIDLLRRDAVVYGGYSAGICVLAPSLRGLELEGLDDPELVPATYGAPPIWDGLGLFDTLILPHYESPGHPETEAVGRAVEHFRAAGLPHLTLRDGQAIVVDGTATETV
jgi:dipeptidase E